jgi:hypothetical protein
METLQTLLSLAAALNLEGLGASEHVYWFDGIPENLYTDPFPRAVTVGTDALLQRTVIRYINGYTSDTGEGGGSGDDDDASDEDATGGGSDGGGNQGSDDGGGAPSDGPGANQGGGGDGGCSVAHAQNLHALWGFAFVIACVMARRRVRRNNRN